MSTNIIKNSKFAGLVNYGNTCFMNSALQCLLNTNELFENHIQKCQKFCFFCELINLKKEQKIKSVLKPLIFAKNLKNISKSFRLGDQEDAHEFYRLFLNKIYHSDINQSLDQKSQSKTSFIEKLFQMQIKSQITCLNCKNKSVVHEKYLDLSLEINNCKNLIESLNTFFKIEKLYGDNKYRCEKCKHLVDAHKQFLIGDPPKNLAIHLKRFTNYSQKINKKIDFPFQINLQKYTDKQININFELYAILIHQGSSSYSGHYYSYIKNGNQWVQLNDEYSSITDQNTILKQNPYMLFYKQIEPIKKINFQNNSQDSKKINNNDDQIFQNGQTQLTCNQSRKLSNEIMLQINQEVKHQKKVSQDFDDIILNGKSYNEKTIKIQESFQNFIQKKHDGQQKEYNQKENQLNLNKKQLIQNGQQKDNKKIIDQNKKNNNQKQNNYTNFLKDFNNIQQNQPINDQLAKNQIYQQIKLKKIKNSKIQKLKYFKSQLRKKIKLDQQY